MFPYNGAFPDGGGEPFQGPGTLFSNPPSNPGPYRNPPYYPSTPHNPGPAGFHQYGYRRVMDFDREQQMLSQSPTIHHQRIPSHRMNETEYSPHVGSGYRQPPHLDPSLSNPSLSRFSTPASHGDSHSPTPESNSSWSSHPMTQIIRQKRPAESLGGDDSDPFNLTVQPLQERLAAGRRQVQTRCSVWQAELFDGPVDDHVAVMKELFEKIIGTYMSLSDVQVRLDEREEVIGRLQNEIGRLRDEITIMSTKLDTTVMKEKGKRTSKNVANEHPDLKVML